MAPRLATTLEWIEIMVFDARQVWNSTYLPAISPLVRKLIEQLRQPQIRAKEVLTLLECDPHFSARVQEALNSPLASRGSFPTLAAALDTVGPTYVLHVSLAMAIRDMWLGCGTPLPQLALFWRQAVVKAAAAEVLAGRLQAGREAESFLGGLVADVGRLALLRTITDPYLDILHKSQQEHRPAWQVEQSELGVNSARIGSQLIESWGFPPRLVHDLQTQFAPLTVLKQMAAISSFSSGCVVALASAIGDYFCGDERAVAWFRIRELAAEVIVLSERELHDLLKQISDRFGEIAPLMTVGDARLPELETLKAIVVEQLRPIQRRSPAAMSGNHHSPTPAASLPSERRGFTTSAANEQQKNFRDPLTQVYTSDFFEATLYKEVQRCRQSAVPVGVAIVRVDRFDQVIQKFGEPVRDVVLQRVATILKDLLRTSDTIGRFGDQFGILASEPTAKGMQRLADRIRGRVASEQLLWSGQRVQLTVSLGATLALPGRRDEMIGEKVLETAQRAAREAGSAEGNNVYFESLIDEIELQRLFMSDNLRFSRWLIARGVLDIPRVGKALLEYRHQQLRLGDLALRQELLSQEEVNEILREQDESQARFGDVAVRRDLLTEDQLVGLLILQQEDPLTVAELLLRRSVLEPSQLQSLLKEYFSVVPWAAPLYPTAGNS